MRRDDERIGSILKAIIATRGNRGVIATAIDLDYQRNLAPIPVTDILRHAPEEDIATMIDTMAEEWGDEGLGRYISAAQNLVERFALTIWLDWIIFSPSRAWRVGNEAAVVDITGEEWATLRQETVVARDWTRNEIRAFDTWYENKADDNSMSFMYDIAAPQTPMFDAVRSRLGAELQRVQRGSGQGH